MRKYAGPSVILITKNEEKNIEKCLKSLSWCDEIIVVDDYSTDGTLAQISKFKSQDYNLKLKTFRRKLNDDFAGQRNFGLSKAKNEWVLFVDADEVISPDLRDEIGSAIGSQPSAVGWNGFYIKRRDFIWGKELKYGEAGNIRLLRLGRRNAGKWRRKVHEFWDIREETGELKNPIFHFPHPTLYDFINHINHFSTLHAEANRKEGKSSNLLKIIVFPKFKFFQNWVFRFGFLDDMAGFVVALMMSFHSFLSWSKLWLREHKAN